MSPNQAPSLIVDENDVIGDETRSLLYADLNDIEENTDVSIAHNDEYCKRNLSRDTRFMREHNEFVDMIIVLIATATYEIHNVIMRICWCEGD